MGKSEECTDRADAEVASVLVPGQGGIQGMDWVFHTTDRKGQINLDITREHPSFTSAAPDVTERCTGNSSIDGIGELPRNL